MKVLSLFDGISCGRVALERASIKVDKYVAYEIDKYAIQVSKHNFPDIIHCGNVVGADFSQYKGFDLVMGGFPCTDLSIAKRNRKGLNGDHSKLFWELVRAIKEVEPRFWFVENNASMPASDKATITRVLGVEPIMVNSALVSAQQRKRLYWTNIPNISQPKDRGVLLKDVLVNGIGIPPTKSYALTGTYNGAVLKNTLERYQRTMVACPVIIQRARGKNMGGVKHSKSPTLTSCSFEHNNKVMLPVRVGQLKNGSQGCRVYSVYGKSITLCGNGGGGGALTGLYKVDLPDGVYTIRKLFVVECERLQTLPDGYVSSSGISNTRAYKCLGNGWTVDVIVHFFMNMK